MTDLQAAARQHLFGKVLADVAKEFGDEAELLPLLRKLGVRSMDVFGPDGEGTYGTATVAGGKPSARVVDEEALTGWVAHTHPDWMVLTIHPLRLRALLDGITRSGKVVDSLTSEEVPGVELAAGEPYVTIRKDPAAKDALRALLEQSGMLALPAAEQPHDGPA